MRNSLKGSKFLTEFSIHCHDSAIRYFYCHERRKAGFHWQRSRCRSRSKSASDLVKIENRSRNKDQSSGVKLNGIGVGRHGRIRTVPFSSDSAYDSGSSEN